MLPVFHPIVFWGFSVLRFWAPKILLGEIPPIICRELVRALCFQIFWVHNRGKCCPFFTQFFLGLFDFLILGSKEKIPPNNFQSLWRLCDSDFFDAKQGEMLPVFHPICFWGVLIFQLRSKNITGQNSANYLQRTFEGFVIWNCGWKKRGKCCPFSPKLFLRHFKFPFLGSKEDKIQPIIPENLSRLCDSEFLDAKQGEMLPAFHPILFWGFSVLRFWVPKILLGKIPPIVCTELVRALWFQILGVQNRGKCCPFFTQFFLGLFDFPILGSKENKIPPIISTDFVKALRFWLFWCKTGGNAARFVPNLFLRGFDFPIALQKHYWTKFRQVFADNFWRLCDLKLWVRKEGEMLPVFHPIFFEAFQVSDCGLQGG